jgi:FkbM family methyltransferase
MSETPADADARPSGRAANAPPAAGWNEDNLRKEGIAPATVIDVGAGAGTGPLYRAFPDAYHVLIEPQLEFEETLRAHVEKKWRGEVHMTAVGDREGEAVLHVYPGRPMTSSLLERPSGLHRSPETRRVPLTTLDRLATERRWEPPFGLKVDVEGADHLVIEGATEVLKQTQFVIAEIWIAPTFVAGHTFAQFIALMDARGFELRDILSAPRSRRTAETLYVDAFFAPSRPPA